ncbi:unnamed protein product, partial [Mesorhabditis spiculigera]
MGGLNGHGPHTSHETLPQSRSANIAAASSTCDDWEAVCSSLGEERKNTDHELDRFMMQNIVDVKFQLKRSKFAAVGEVNFQRGCLDAHNAMRTKYGNNPLQWSSELGELAHTWAIRLAERGRILYPELAGIGENLHVSPATNTDHLPTGIELVEEWEKESQFFNFERPRWHPKCQHFSQMLWKDSTELGAARYWNTAKNCVAVVCFYRPGGNSNAPGEFANNVPSREASLSPARSLPAHLKRVTISEPPARAT